MKRDIICPGCAIQQRDLFPTDEPYPGEFVKFVSGIARNEYLCDLCGAAINVTDVCIAFSISTERAPYTAWEQNYIDTGEDQ